MESSNEPDKRLPYEKPRLRVISLVAEEVLSINCKLESGNPMGQGGNGCGFQYCQGYGGS